MYAVVVVRKKDNEKAKETLRRFRIRAPLIAETSPLKVFFTNPYRARETLTAMILMNVRAQLAFHVLP